MLKLKLHNYTRSSKYDGGFVIIIFFLVLAAAGNYYNIPDIYSAATVASLIIYLIFKSGNISKHRAPLSLSIVLSLALLYVYLKERWPATYYVDYLHSITPLTMLALLLLITKRLNVNYEISAMCIKYLIWIFFFGYLMSLLIKGDPRPHLIFENNFEIPLISTLVFVLLLNGSARLLSVPVALGAAIAFMSKSRSGIVEFVIPLAFVVLSGGKYSRINNPAKRLSIAVILITTALIAVFVVFRERMSVSSFSHIDRIIMLKSLISALDNSSLYQIIIGHGPLSILSNASCIPLAYYLNTLAGHNGECYSIVLHAFYMRFVFDYGFLGLAIYLYVIYRIIRMFYTATESIIVLSPVLLAGFSVGGFYNALSMLGLVIAIIVRKKYIQNTKSGSDAISARHLHR